jgi:F420-non-reducing hydrogenase iron-sulfur subunit
MRVIRVMCTGRIEPSYILNGFIYSADGIFVGG